MLAGEISPSIPVVSKSPTLILGMDVSHGSPGQSDIPSIAAVRALMSLIFIYDILSPFCIYMLHTIISFDLTGEGFTYFSLRSPLS